MKNQAKLAVMWIVLVLAGLGFEARADEGCIPCDRVKKLTTDSAIATATEGQIREFLLTFRDDCNFNETYSQYSNDVLFKLLERQPGKLIKVLAEGKGIDVEYILKEIEDPLVNANIKHIKHGLARVNGYPKTKARVLSALEGAMAKGQAEE